MVFVVPRVKSVFSLLNNHLSPYSLYRVSQKNSSGHFRSYLTIAIEFFDTLNMKIITNKFSINFEKMAVWRSLCKFLHGLKVDATVPIWPQKCISRTLLIFPIFCSRAHLKSCDAEFFELFKSRLIDPCEIPRD